jgi:hypothetical protein
MKKISSFAFPLLFVLGLGNHPKDNSPGSSPSNPIQIISDTCISNDTMSTLVRWYIIYPDSSSMSITINNLSASDGHIHEFGILEGTYPHMRSIGVSSLIGNDTSKLPLNIKISDLFIGKPIYIKLGRGRERMGCKGCSPLKTAHFSLCVKDISKPIRTVNEQGVVLLDGRPDHMANQIILQFCYSALLVDAINDESLVEGNIAAFIKPGMIKSLALSLSDYGILDSVVREIKLQKVYPKFTLKDSVTISLQGRPVHNQHLWDTFVMLFPTDSIGASLMPYNEVQMGRILTHMSGIGYVEVNGVVTMQNFK